MTSTPPASDVVTIDGWDYMTRPGVQVIPDRRPGARARHGRVDWARLTPVQSLTMLAAMIEASADTTSPKGSRHCTVAAIRDRVRHGLSAGRILHTWSALRQVDDAIIDLDRRGALRLYEVTGTRLDWWRVPRLLGEDRAHVDAWPVPGGAPW